MEPVLQFLYGGLTVMCILIGVFFLRYWRLQRDRFFLGFGVAFWAFAGSWGIHLVLATSLETGPGGYVLRLLGFVCIIISIIDKNRRAARIV